MGTAYAEHFILNQSDATVQDWIGTFIAMLDQIGLVRTADTGQVNEATVTFPNTVNTLMGYAIYRFDDPAQATRPIFLRFEFRTGAVAARCIVHAYVGTGSNGSGTLTDSISIQTTTSAGAAATAEQKSWMAYYPGTLLIFWGDRLVNQRFYCVVSRSFMNNTPTDAGWVAHGGTSSTTGAVVHTGVALLVATTASLFTAVNAAVNAMHTLGYVLDGKDAGEVVCAPMRFQHAVDAPISENPYVMSVQQDRSSQGNAILLDVPVIGPAMYIGVGVTNPGWSFTPAGLGHIIRWEPDGS